MSRPTILHVAEGTGSWRLFVRAFAESGLAGTVVSLPSPAEAFLYLNRMSPYESAARPRLIILDMEPLPLMGRDFLMILRSNLKLRSIPVVVFAGSEDFLDMQRCRELHVEDYVVKPQRFEELVGMIGSLDHLLAGSSTGAPALG